MTKCIAISGKGGSGKTTVAVNLASALHNSGKNVILLDANTAAPHVAMHMGFPELNVSLHEVLEGKNSITEAIYLHPSGLKVIPSNISKNPAYKKNRKIGSVLLDLIGKAAVVVMDLPPTLSEETLSAIKAADETIVVTNPEVVSLADALKTIKLAEDSGSVVPGVILNKSKRNYKIEFEQLSKRLISTIPEDKNIPKSLSMGHPVVYSHPFSPAALEFRRLADTLS
jgi:MinD-like ATPase involved in chromosome partitioning or flagellar assembly|tara:strand:+ start:952 stop:1632 length:681 start_codon:yes stop_codon:yes gene_type:complete